VKTRKVDGVQLWPSSFAYVGDESDTSTWKLPIHFPGDEAKTRNHIKSGLHRFDEMTGIPDTERASLRLILFGAARSHGIPVERRQFSQSVDESHLCVVGRVLPTIRRTRRLQKRIQDEIASEMEREKHQKQTAALMMGAPKPL
jgi:hypothetical protein